MEILSDKVIQAWLDVGNGNGYGYGYGNGKSEFEGHKLYLVDRVPTAITAIKGNFAKGFMLQRNVIRKPCFIAKGGGKFAHGDTLRDAFFSLQEKLYDDSTEEERIAAFKSKFPEYDTPYPNRDLFAFHHVLTGSCRMGREQFCANHGINMEASTTVREFSHINEGNAVYPYRAISASSCMWAQCIPYEGNEHLAGTSNSPK